MTARRCGGRCWFAYYGWVGSSSPTCRRCGRTNPHYRPSDDPFAPRGTALVNQAESIHAEVRDPMNDDVIVSGWGVIIPGADLPDDVIARAVVAHHGDSHTRLVVEVQHLTYQARVMWCSRHGSGWGCDSEGEWHAHWHPVKHNPAADPTCCHTIAVPIYPEPAWRTA